MNIPRCFDLRGRIGRRAFALSQVPIALVAAFLVLAGLGADGYPGTAPEVAFALLSLKPVWCALAAALGPLLWFSLCQASKRAHDLGVSGYVCTIFLAPLFNILLYIIMFWTPSRDRDNPYGARDCG